MNNNQKQAKQTRKLIQLQIIWGVKMTKLKGIEQGTISREREKALFYKKQLRGLIPKENRIGKNFYETINKEYKTELKAIIQLAIKEAEEQKRKTIFGSDIKKAIQQQRETYGAYMLEHIDTAVIGKIKEMRENVKGVKQWTTKTQ
jgi:histone H3/H4